MYHIRGLPTCTNANLRDACHEPPQILGRFRLEIRTFGAVSRRGRVSRRQVIRGQSSVCVDFNATQAAIRAGYSAETARSIANRLRAHPAVAAPMTQASAALKARCEASSERWLLEVLDVAFADPDAKTPDGKPATRLTVSEKVRALELQRRAALGFLEQDLDLRAQTAFRSRSCISRSRDRLLSVNVEDLELTRSGEWGRSPPSFLCVQRGQHHLQNCLRGHTRGGRALAVASAVLQPASQRRRRPFIVRTDTAFADRPPCEINLRARP